MKKIILILTLLIFVIGCVEQIESEGKVKECIMINQEDKKEVGGIGVLCDEKQDCFDFLEDRTSERGESLNPEALKYDYKCVKTSFKPILAAVADLPENGEQVLCDTKDDCNFLGRYLGFPDFKNLTAIRCEDNICMATKGINKVIGFMPMTCIIEVPGISCDNFKVDASDRSIQLILMNKMDDDLSDVSVAVGACTTYEESDITWAGGTILGDDDGIRLTGCTDVGSAGRNYMASIIVSYKSNIGVEHSKIGRLVTNVEP